MPRESPVKIDNKVDIETHQRKPYFLNAEERKRSIFVKGFQGDNIEAFILERLGVEEPEIKWSISRREGKTGTTYRITCDSEEKARLRLTKKKQLRGCLVWIEEFKTRDEREIQRNRKEWLRLWDERTEQTPQVVLRRHNLQMRFLYLARRREELE